LVCGAAGVAGGSADHAEALANNAIAHTSFIFIAGSSVYDRRQYELAGREGQWDLGPMREDSPSF